MRAAPAPFEGAALVGSGPVDKRLRGREHELQFARTGAGSLLPEASAARRRPCGNKQSLKHPPAASGPNTDVFCTGPRCGALWQRATAMMHVTGRPSNCVTTAAAEHRQKNAKGRQHLPTQAPAARSARPERRPGPSRQNKLSAAAACNARPMVQPPTDRLHAATGFPDPTRQALSTWTSGQRTCFSNHAGRKQKKKLVRARSTS